MNSLNLSQIIQGTGLLTIILGYFSVHITQWAKSPVPTTRREAIIMAAIVALFLAVLELYVTGQVVTLNDLLHQSTEIFTFSTLYYHLLLGQNTNTNISSQNGQLDQGSDKAPGSPTQSTGSTEGQENTQGETTSSIKA